MVPTPERPQKRQRVSYACDFCHRRGLKCKTSSANQGPNASCLTCVEYGQSCTRTRRPKKRGTKPRGSELNCDGTTDGDARLSAGGSPCLTTIVPVRGAEGLSRDLIKSLLDVYLDSVHPVFPLYCERELWVHWHDGSFPSTTGQWTAITAMCALSMYHVRHGALFHDAAIQPDSEDLFETLLAEATKLTPVDFWESHDLETVRAYAFLAILGIQSKDYALTHKYLALWHGLCGLCIFHDESRWPSNLSDCEVEVRRRLFWISYRLEVQMACITGQIIRCPEVQCHVGYPQGTHHPAFVSGRNGLFEEWFPGWNLTNDLYRLLEHVLVQLRSKSSPSESSLENHNNHLEKLDRLQQEVHSQFLVIYERSGVDSGRDRCGFQATHILATVHLVRVTALLLTHKHEFSNILAATKAMVSALACVPTEYIRAMGTPLLQNLTGTALILQQLACINHIRLDEQQGLVGLIDSMIRLFSTVKRENDSAVEVLTKLKGQLQGNILDHSIQPMDEETSAEAHGEEVWPDLGDWFTDALWPFDFPSALGSLHYGEFDQATNMHGHLDTSQEYPG